jgi:hypothetical protein
MGCLGRRVRRTDKGVGRRGGGAGLTIPERAAPRRRQEQSTPSIEPSQSTPTPPLDRGHGASSSPLDSHPSTHLRTTTYTPSPPKLFLPA